MRSNYLIGKICAVTAAVILAAGLGVCAATAANAAAPSHAVSFYSSTNLLTAPMQVQYVQDGTLARNPGAATYNAYPMPLKTPTFTGWYAYSPGAGISAAPYNFSAPVTGDLTLVAQFDFNVVVTYLNGYGNVFLTQSVPVGGAVTPPGANDAVMQTFTAPPGKVFDGWLLNGSPYTGGTVTGDLTLTPLLSAKYYVFFISNGSQVPFETVAQGAAATQPAPPTRAGYSFAGWMDASTGMALISARPSPRTSR